MRAPGREGSYVLGICSKRTEHLLGKCGERRVHGTVRIVQQKFKKLVEGRA